MYLKSLQLKGFKSFADKTTLKFEPGITAVVGPNGCGKSNISDAIQWVIGEQSSLALRVKHQEELIFNGSQSRRSESYASISLTIDNSEGEKQEKPVPVVAEKQEINNEACAQPDSLQVEVKDEDGKVVTVTQDGPEWKNSPEIVITRRFYNSGEGEYFINKQPVRLKDIANLFMDTGLGENAYSLLERKKVEMIVTGKPDERRYIFEEAAGIMKYRYRKVETLRKLDDTKANLLRLTDILSEVKKSINVIRRQVSKAERYKKHKQELKDLEARFLVTDLARINKEWDSIKEDLEKARKDDEGFRQVYSSLEEKVDKLRLELEKKEADLRGQRDRHYEAISGRERAGSQVSILEERKKNLTRREHEIVQELDRIETKISSIDLRIKNVISEREEIKVDIGNYNVKITQVKNELGDIEHKLKESQAREKDLLCFCCSVCTNRNERDGAGCFLCGKRFNEVADSGPGSVGDANTTHQETEGFKKARDEKFNELNELRVKAVSLEERIESRKNDEARFREEKEEIIHLKSEWEKEKGGLPITALEMDRELERVKTQMQDLLKLAEESKTDIHKYEKEYAKARETVLGEDEKLKEMRRGRGSEEAKLRELEIKEIQFKLEGENIMGKLQEFGISADAGNAPQASQEEEVPEEEMKARIKTLRESIEKIGEVNLVAPEEYQRLKERYLFLKKQMDDLLKSEEDLRSIIIEIEKTCKVRFSDTFNRIKGNFEDIYTRLFQGGEAKLFLTNPDDPLESGIEIIAQPPGKKLHILQLSEGERALTAIALLFAIFQVRPSPFCVLDEIDAPLDDANIMRFTKLLKEFSQFSQFIVITHNKRTMESANILYGVTMQEQGVSRIISVKMGDAASQEAREPVTAS